MLGLEIISWLRIKTLVPAQVTGFIIEEGCFWIRQGHARGSVWLASGDSDQPEVGVFFARLVVVFWL